MDIYTDRITPEAPHVDRSGPYREGGMAFRRTTYAALDPAHPPILGPTNDRVTVWSDLSFAATGARLSGAVTLVLDEHGSPFRRVDPDDRAPGSAVVVLNEVDDMIAVRDALTAAIEALQAQPVEVSR